MSSSKEKTFWQDRRVHAVVEKLKSPILVGIAVTLCYLVLTWKYYEIKNLNENTRGKVVWFDVLESLNLKSMDLRFRWRDVTTPTAKVGLLTIDDRSIEEIGRWPWSREKIAFVVNEMMKYGAQAIGFDIVFSEPQADRVFETLSKIEAQVPLGDDAKELISQEKNNARPDTTLAKVLEANKEKLILGAFDEEPFAKYEPYQDYCRTEAFLRHNANKFIKLEMSTKFIIVDSVDRFDGQEFTAPLAELINFYFSKLEEKNTSSLLKSVFHRENMSELDEVEKRKLKYLLTAENIKYCDTWLTDSDIFFDVNERTVAEKRYLEIFQTSALLKGLSFKDAFQKFKELNLTIPIKQRRKWVINIDLFQDATLYTGSFNAEQDEDGTIRNASMFYRTGNRTGTSYIPTLALQTYLVATSNQARIDINSDPKDPKQKKITKFEIFDVSKEPEEKIADVPVDPQGQMKINYYGGTYTFPYLPAKELFNKSDKMKITQSRWDPTEKKFYIDENIEVSKAEFIKDRTFIFGATAIGVYDLRVTPFEKNYPGPETHLTTLANLMEHNFIKVHPNEPTLMLLALSLFGLLLTIGVSHAGAIPGFGLTATALFGIFLFDGWLFKKGMIASMILPFFLVFILYTCLTLYKYLTEELKKKHLRSTFSKYVSPAIVDEILKHPENIQLGGKKLRMSVFFSDVRGFTTISEKLDPRVLSDVLNKYLTPMTQIVFENKGTLDKYMGDAVMAFFGAPITFADHAAHACRCALKSIEKLKEIQNEFKTLGYPPIDIGIGVNTGDMSVGNMGSDTVRSYTVMGDAVNLGSRLEGINKEYGTRIIISEFTYSEVKNSFTAREVDWVKVKGKNEPVKIYELMCEGPPPSPQKECIEEFSHGFELYHLKKFDEAIMHFKKALEYVPTDPPSALYLERCAEYKAEPPPEIWDGVYTMKTK